MAFPKIMLIIVPLVWCGMLASISFIEAPIKFRAPGVTLSIGLGIGKLVFRALNKAEWVLAFIWFIAAFSCRISLMDLFFPAFMFVILALQSFWLLPALEHRAALIFQDLPVANSSLHWFYIAGEAAKMIVLLGTSVILLKKDL